jgi:hypothetical protein
MGGTGGEIEEIEDVEAAEPDPRLQRAYGALLGDDYERNLMAHAIDLDGAGCCI